MPDITPNSFSGAFNDVSNADLNTEYTSNSITIGGLEANYSSVTVTVTGGTVDAGTTELSGTFESSKTVTTSATGTILVAARGTSSGDYETDVDVVITCDTESDTFKITTKIAPTRTLIIANTEPTVELYSIKDGSNTYILAQDGFSANTPLSLSVQIDYSSYYARIANALESIQTIFSQVSSNINSISIETTAMNSKIDNLVSHLDVSVSGSFANIVATEISTIDNHLDSNVSGSFANVVNSHMDSNVSGSFANIVATEISTIDNHLDAAYANSYANVIVTELSTSNSALTLSESILKIYDAIENVNAAISVLSIQSITTNSHLKKAADHYEVERALNIADIKSGNFYSPTTDKFAAVSDEVKNPTQF